MAMQVGPSHRGHLEAVKRIPTQGARGRALQQHALFALLCTILPVRPLQSLTHVHAGSERLLVLGLRWMRAGSVPAGAPGACQQGR